MLTSFWDVDFVLRTAYNVRQKVSYVKCYVTSEKDWVWSSVKMTDLWSAVQAINDLIVRIERMENSSEIGSIVLRLDFINRMLVSLDVPDDIVNTTSALYETTVAHKYHGKSFKSIPHN